jgi:hypothetical protein
MAYEGRARIAQCGDYAVYAVRWLHTRGPGRTTTTHHWLVDNDLRKVRSVGELHRDVEALIEEMHERGSDDE